MLLCGIVHCPGQHKLSSTLVYAVHNWLAEIGALLVQYMATVYGLVVVNRIGKTKTGIHML